MKRWYRSRRNQFIVITISILCFIYYIRLNNKLSQGRDQGLGVTRKYIENIIEKALSEDKGSGCKMPNLDPFSKELMQFFDTYEPITCKGKDWVKCYLSECRVVDEILATTRNIVCTYQDIIHVNDNKHYLGQNKIVKGNETYLLDASDHVKIKCTGTNGTSLLSSSWVGYQLGFRKSLRRVPPPPDRKDTINVLMFAFDSTSKNSFIRQMPKSLKYLKDQAKATILNGHGAVYRTHSSKKPGPQYVDLLETNRVRYNIVGDGTTAAIFPLLTGKNEFELPDFRRGTKNNNIMDDDMPLIFYKLTRDGYRTAYFEDMQSGGTFQYRFKGFQRQPVDHYTRSFFLEENKHRKWDNSSKWCVGDTPQFELMMNITEQFMSLNGKRFAFTFLAEITHDVSMISVADDALVKFLQALEKKNVFEDTLLIIMGDHGPRFNLKMRNTLQGKLEERLALMALRLPEKLKKIRPNAQANLEANANVLTTPHDIHATILDALDWTEDIDPFKINGADLPRSMSLLEPIPMNRSCSEAGVQPHWCACVSWKNVTDVKMIRKSADAFIKFLNELTESQRSKCAIRTLTEVKWVMSLRPHIKMLTYVFKTNQEGFLGRFGAQTKATQVDYQLKVVVGPGEGVYEASMTYFQNEDKFVMSKRDISRTSKYGTEPSCISATHPHLNPYCYCKDYVPP